MVDITRDIQWMTSFQNRCAEIVQRLEQTKRPIASTVNGEAAPVADRRTRPAAAIFDEPRAAYGASR